jgi:hypothetical protein
MDLDCALVLCHVRMVHLPLFGIAESYCADSDELLFVSESELDLRQSDTCAYLESEGWDDGDTACAFGG